MPTKIGIVIVAFLVIANLIGEALELKGKIAPEYLKMRKYFTRKKKEKIQINKTLKEVQAFLKDVNEHYSNDNIAKRNAWMQWVNDRAKVYDALWRKACEYVVNHFTFFCFDNPVFVADFYDGTKFIFRHCIGFGLRIDTKQQKNSS